MDLPVPAELSGAFAPGVPAVDAFSVVRWRRLLEQEWRRSTPNDLAYGEACGESSLRVAIADYLRASRGVICEPEQVVITDGTQSSLGFMCTSFRRCWRQSVDRKSRLCWRPVGLQSGTIAHDRHRCR